ncbi:MAG: hypothetical protein WCJ07_08575 [Verrucomicrobiota bacterium]
MALTTLRAMGLEFLKAQHAVVIRVQLLEDFFRAGTLSLARTSGTAWASGTTGTSLAARRRTGWFVLGECQRRGNSQHADGCGDCFHGCLVVGWFCFFTRAAILLAPDNFSSYK